MERGPLGPVALVLSNVRGEGRARDALAAETARKPRVHGGCRREPHVVEAGAPCAGIGGRLVGVVPTGGFVRAVPGNLSASGEFPSVCRNFGHLSE